MITFVGDDENRSLQGNILAECYVSNNSQMVEFKDIGNTHEALQVVCNLGEVGAKLHKRELRVGSERVTLQDALVKVVDVGLHVEQVRGGLHWEEPSSGNIDSEGVLEALDGGTDGSLELNNVSTVSKLFVVRNDVQWKGALFEFVFQATKVDPNVVGVKDLELGDGLELLNVLR